MLTSEALLETDRASRYLEQLCRHASLMGRSAGHLPRSHGGAGRQPDIARAEWSATEGVIVADGATCTLHAGDRALRLQVEATDEESLARIRSLLAKRIETIGRRDGLRMVWSPESGALPTPSPSGPAGTRSHRTTTTTAVAITLAAAIHFGLGAVLVANAGWASWTVGSPAGVVVLKAVAVAVLPAAQAALTARPGRLGDDRAGPSGAGAAGGGEPA